MYSFSLVIDLVLLQWCCICKNTAVVWAAGLVDTSSFMTESSASDNNQQPSAVISYDVRDLFDTDSFLSSPTLVVKMDKSKSKQRGFVSTSTASALSSIKEQEDEEEETEDSIFSQAMTAISNHLYPAAIQLLQELINRSPHESNYHFNLGTAHQEAGDFAKALSSYQTSIHLQPRETRALLNFGTLVQSIGDFELAASTYRRILGIMDKLETNDEISMYCKVMSNLGSSYFQGSKTTEAKAVFVDLSDLLWNLIQLNCHHVNLNLPGNELLRQTCMEMQVSYDQAINYLITISHSLAVLKEREVSVSYLLRRTLNRAAPSLFTDPAASLLMLVDGEESAGPLLPFDSLVNEVSLAHRLVIARAASKNLLATLPAAATSTPVPAPFSTPSHTKMRNNRKLKIGFITCDFNDHPTAHLVEGIFAIVQQQRSSLVTVGTSRGGRGMFDMELVAFSYGPPDNSIFRRKIKESADRFIDLAELSNAEASDVIRLEEIDILLDMQLYTLGHRLQITAAQPAPVQMNYLVYPGTSGASFLQYLVTDRVVTPAEHAEHYSEAFLMLPSTYQVSIYDRYEVKYATAAADTTLTNTGAHMLDPQLNSTAAPFAAALNSDRVMVLCNFNKIDKFDSDSFTIWPQIMSRFPASVFRLVIDTREEVVHIIHSEFAMRGVHPRRVNFLPRVSKEEHIRRHRDMDLFVDSLVYGAHSTATDALRGGLPVLTVEGGTFPQRVGASLLASLSPPEEGGEATGAAGQVNSHKHKHQHQHQHQQQQQQQQQHRGESLAMLSKVLCTFSKKSFEDVAVKLLRSPVMLQKLRNLLIQASGDPGDAVVATASLKGGGEGRGRGDRERSVGHTRTGLFDTEGRVMDFLRGMQAAAEVEQLQLQLRGGGRNSKHGKDKDKAKDSKRAHIIVTNN